jgi:hypothetical protein
VTTTVLAQVLQVLKLMIKIGEQPLDTGQKINADLAQLKAPRRPVEQPYAQFFFQLSNGLAYRRLRYAERPRGRAKAAGLDHRYESSQLAEIEIYCHQL